MRRIVLRRRTCKWGRTGRRGGGRCPARAWRARGDGPGEAIREAPGASSPSSMGRKGTPEDRRGRQGPPGVTRGLSPPPPPPRPAPSPSAPPLPRWGVSVLRWGEEQRFIIYSRRSLVLKTVGGGSFREMNQGPQHGRWKSRGL